MNRNDSNRMSFSSFSSYLIHFLLISVSVETRSKYLGCYFDSHPGRRLPGHSKDFGKYLTHQTCIDYCKDKGYLYAGVQARYEPHSFKVLFYH